MQLFLGLIAAIIVAFLAYRVHSLSCSGAIAAVVVGTFIFGLGGWQWAVILLTFFLSSSILTRLFKKHKAEVDEKFSKGGQRDAGQVLANGGIAAVFAALHAIFPAASWTWWAFAASMAAVNADTWATELGVINPALPRLITNGRAVDRGTSGAISLYGTLAALGGASLVALLAVLIAPFPPSWPYSVMIALAGLLGAFFDSLLGATVQAIYQCPACKKETERHPRHLCDTPTVHLRGWKWLDNDLVNLACAITGAGAMLIASIFL
jgi:uncharacterized protein (TIGR00297 family)